MLYDIPKPTQRILPVGALPPDEHGRREYIVTVKEFQYLESLYDDMETFGGTFYVPERVIPVYERRPISRNTHYMLTDNEANLLKHDPRILDVELSHEALGAVMKVHSTQTFNGDFDKSSTNSNTMINWGLLRCVLGNTVSGWGDDGTSNVNTTIQLTTTGKNVDVVIAELGNLDPTHPEYAVNADGTGGSRVIQYNWLKDTPNVTGAAANTYSYTSDTYGEHQTLVGGVAAGNKQGWARDSNIYSIGPQGAITTNNMYDYIRYFHLTKPINSITGRRNPTVVNNSWGAYSIWSLPSYGATASLANGVLSLIQIGGVTANTYKWTTTDFYYPATKTANTITWTATDGILTTDGSNYIIYQHLFSTANYVDMQDCLSSGIVVVASAGNESIPLGNSFSADTADYWNDYLFWQKTGYYDLTLYIHRGGHPAAIPGVICVGATSNHVSEEKSYYSNTGPRVDVYAPGDNIMGPTSLSGAIDNRNPSYYLAKNTGTSFSGPQVTGMIACMMELYPTLGSYEFIRYMRATGTKNQLDISIATGWLAARAYKDVLSANGNNYMYYTKERYATGAVYPKENVYIKPSTGQVWPRPRIRIE